MPNFWTIENATPAKGAALNGLQIQPIYNSATPPVITGYQLMNGSSQLTNGLYSSTTMPVTFNNVPFASNNWNISAEIPTPGVDGSGSWAKLAKAQPADDGDNGEFTAQTGTAEDPDDAASSAKA